MVENQTNENDSTISNVPSNEDLTVGFGVHQLSLWVVICPCIVVINICVISLICWQRKKKRIQCHLYIVSLAISDLLVGTAAFVSHVIFATQPHSEIRDAATCIIAGTFTWTFLLESLNHLTMVSVDRMVSVVWPLKYRVYIQTSAVWWVITLTWVLSLCEGALSGIIVFYVSLDFQSQNNADDTCISGGFFDVKDRGFHLYTWIRFVVAYVGILGSYTYMILAHRKHVRLVVPASALHSLSGSIVESASRKSASTSAEEILRKRKADAAASKTWKLGRAVINPIIAVTVMLFPRMIYHFTQGFGLAILPTAYLNFSILMVALNSGVNPFLYSKCIPELKKMVVDALKSAKDVLTCGKFGNQNEAP
ncbi:trace amine-associated receptor 6-like [Amphiura filiformis]|uniref:trace amine-associated receptor 6-like n=1 Tax=Amphiura filiformis TaxID=82378 RepID=UPI003B221EF5